MHIGHLQCSQIGGSIIHFLTLIYFFYKKNYSYLTLFLFFCLT